MIPYNAFSEIYLIVIIFFYRIVVECLNGLG